MDTVVEFMAEPLIYYASERPTKAGQALADRLEKLGKPLITPYELFLEFRSLYASNEKLYLKGKTAKINGYNRIRKNLQRSSVIIEDRDYHRKAYRIIKNSDKPADEICCIVDPYCYIAYLSAMQRYGLTNRSPKSLLLCRPNRGKIKKLIQDRMEKDYRGEIPKNNDEFVPLSAITHPTKVRGRSVSVIDTKNWGEFNKIKNEYSRIATIEQTFLDMLIEPKLCGGMAHVIDIWKDRASDYLEGIINITNKCETKIVRIRAGYIIDEIMNISNPTVESWTKLAQRGGSMILDPNKPFSANYSEKWMLSIND